MLKKFSFPISILYTLTLSALSLIKISHVVKNMPSFNDKVGHALAHFIFVVLWFVVFYYKFNFKYGKALGFAGLFSFGYGVLIEGLQGWITISRQSDFNDVFANVIGMVFALLLLLSIKKRVLKSNNTLLF
ncbi:VanZ family protein [Lacinutrix jangbogonensis]|uniref:VanZ family protein n=1 Tax=Lacinutrix jangbogonensis TaxID=1469557 RepID=UPI00053D0B33|nr:VanZ family protein [Lacinutrix jangbogonensis]